MFRTPGILLLLGAPAWAATPGERSPAPTDLQAAKDYAVEMANLVSVIGDQYVRDVSPAELYEKAIVALYETARQPLPSGLLLDLKKADTFHQQLQILILARAKLGSCPELEANRDLIVSIKALPNALDPYCGLVVSHEFQGRGEVVINFGFDLEGDSVEQTLFRRLPEARSNPRAMPSFPFRVLAVRPGGPAQLAGMRPGDQITHIDNRLVRTANAAELYEEIFLGLIDPGETKETTFTIQRAGRESPLLIKIRKLAYTSETVFGVSRGIGNEWNYWLDREGKIAYIRVGAIDTGTPAQLAAALDGVRDAAGLILDLRWCPGGYLTQSAEIAGMFLEKGQIASLKYRHLERQGPTQFRAEDVGLARFRAAEHPMLVLVNGETMGGGELIACALQDNRRAVVAGQRTLGKGSIQTPLYVNNLPGWTFKLTAGTFHRPSGKNLQRFPDSTPQDDWGVRPDSGREIAVSPSLAKQYKEWHTLYALRPGSDREAMPLDDYRADSQRYVALKMLRKLIDDAGKKDD